MVFLVSDLPSLLLEAVKRYRPVPCAIGVAGVGAAAAIVYTALKEDSRSAANSAAIMLGFMVVLLVFASLMRTKSTTYVMRAFLMMWVMVACFCPIFVQLSSFIFRWPTVKFGTGESLECEESRRKSCGEGLSDSSTDQCVLTYRSSSFLKSGSPNDWQRLTEKARTYARSVSQLPVRWPASRTCMQRWRARVSRTSINCWIGRVGWPSIHYCGMRYRRLNSDA